MTKKNILKEFKQIYPYLTLKNKILLFFDKRKYDIMYYMNSDMKKFNFINDETYIKEIKLDFNNFNFFMENDSYLDTDDTDIYWNLVEKQLHYECFMDTDNRIPEKFKPFFYRVKGDYSIMQKLPASISMKKDIINAIFDFLLKMVHVKTNNNLPKLHNPCFASFNSFDFNYASMDKEDIKSTYENIINNNITKL